jgi:WD40 repeat protein
VQVNSIEFSKDSEKVFFTDKNSVKVWNLADDTCKIIESLPFEEKTLKKLIVDHENNLLAYCINNQITVKSLKNLNFIKEFNFYSQVIYHNQFINKKIIVWTGLHGFHFISLDNSINECFAGHPSMINNARISGNQLIIITSANDFTIRLWNTVSKVEKIIPCLNTPPKALGISFDGCLVAALTEKILLWQVQKDILIQTKTNLNLPETILNISIINSSRLLLATDKFTFLSITLE